MILPQKEMHMQCTKWSGENNGPAIASQSRDYLGLPGVHCTGPGVLLVLHERNLNYYTQKQKLEGKQTNGLFSVWP